MKQSFETGHLFDFKSQRNWISILKTVKEVKRSKNNTILMPPPNLILTHGIIQISAPSGQNGVQMPYVIVGFVCQIPFLKKNNLQIQVVCNRACVSKHANTFPVTLYMIIPFLAYLSSYKNAHSVLKLLIKITENWINY